MDIRCERCGTEYELDEDRIPEAGINVRCADCELIFRVFRPAPAPVAGIVPVSPAVPEPIPEARTEASSEPVSEPTPAVAPAPSPTVAAIRVRESGADVADECADIPTLQRWVIEGRVGSRHEVSLDGGPFAPASSFAELAPFLSLIESAAVPAPAAEDAAVTRPEFGRVPSSDAGDTAVEGVTRDAAENAAAALTVPAVPVFSESTTVSTSTTSEARTEAPASESPAPDSRAMGGDEEDPEVALLRSQSRRRLQLAAVALVLVVGGAALWLALGGSGDGVTDVPVVAEVETAPDKPSSETPPDATGDDETKEAEATAEAGTAGSEAKAPAPEQKAATSTRTADVKPSKAEPAPPRAAKPASAVKPPASPSAPTPPTPAAQQPPSIDALLVDAGAALDDGQAVRALELFDKAAQLRPKHVEAHYGRGLALYDLNRSAPAIEAFQTALNLNPRFADAMIGLAEVYKEQGKNQEAVRWYRSYLETLPNGDQAEVARANVERLGN